MGRSAQLASAPVVTRTGEGQHVFVAGKSSSASRDEPTEQDMSPTVYYVDLSRMEISHDHSIGHSVKRTVKALDRVSQNLDVFFAELEERAQPVPRMIRTPNDLAASVLADRRLR
jgi:hypothetical protein